MQIFGFQAAGRRTSEIGNESCQWLVWLRAHFNTSSECAEPNVLVSVGTAAKSADMSACEWWLVPQAMCPLVPPILRFSDYRLNCGFELIIAQTGCFWTHTGAGDTRAYRNCWAWTTAGTSGSNSLGSSHSQVGWHILYKLMGDREIIPQLGDLTGQLLHFLLQRSDVRWFLTALEITWGHVWSHLLHVLLMVGTLLKGLHSNWHQADEMISQKSFFSRRTRQRKVTPWHPRQVCTRLSDQIFIWDTLNKHPTGLCYTKLGRIVYWHTSWPWTLDSGLWTLDPLPYCLLLPFPSRWHLDSGLMVWPPMAGKLQYQKREWLQPEDDMTPGGDPRHDPQHLDLS